MFLVQKPPSSPSTPREPYFGEVGHAHRIKATVEGSLKILDRKYVVTYSLFKFVKWSGFSALLFRYLVCILLVSKCS